MGYRRDIRNAFPNDHVHLTPEAISRIALNVEVKNRRQGKDRPRDSAVGPSCNAASKPHKGRNKSRRRKRRRSRFGDRGRSEKSMDNGKRCDSDTLRPKRGQHG